ncbi:hypothetical protein [Haloarchaeobius sp. DT45]|uniref:hypothetical protein n=1 Tax=Haloarchaeobius sp. DT45 TaxID=3446116 RepID=UPI003F6B4004
MKTDRRGTTLLFGCLVCALLLTPGVGATDGGGRPTVGQTTGEVNYAITVTGGDASPGETMTVELTVTNEGSAVAESVRAEAQLRRPDARQPVGWSIVDHTDDGGQFGDRGIVWQWTSLEPGQSVTTSVTVQVPTDAAPGEVSVSALVSDRSRNQAMGNATVVVTEPDDGSGGQDGSDGQDGADGGDGADDGDGSKEGDESDENDGSDGGNGEPGEDGESGGLQPGDGDDDSDDGGDSGEGEDSGRRGDTERESSEDEPADGTADDDGTDEKDSRSDDREDQSESGDDESQPDGKRTDEPTGDGVADEGSTGGESDSPSSAGTATETNHGGDGGTDTANVEGKATGPSQANQNEAVGDASDEAAADATSSTVLRNQDDSVEFLTFLDAFGTPVEQPRMQDFDGVFGILSFACMGTLVARRIQ